MTTSKSILPSQRKHRITHSLTRLSRLRPDRTHSTLKMQALKTRRAGSNVFRKQSTNLQARRERSPNRPLLSASSLSGHPSPRTMKKKRKKTRKRLGRRTSQRSGVSLAKADTRPSRLRALPPGSRKMQSGSGSTLVLLQRRMARTLPTSSISRPSAKLKLPLLRPGRRTNLRFTR